MTEEKLSKQEIFNQAYLGLKAQGFKRSMQEGESELYCAYRGENGMKCAVGHLLTDEEAAGLGNGSVSFVRAQLPSRLRNAKDVFDDSLVFLSHLQNAHDSGVFPESMKRKLHQLANDYSLTIPED